MPNYKKQHSKHIDIKKGPASLKASLGSGQAARLHRFMQRQKTRKSAERTASERFSEYSGKGREKQKLRDINAPKTIQEKSSDTLKKFVKYLKVHKAPRDERAIRHIKPKHLLGILAAVCVVLIILSGINENIRTPFKSAVSVMIVPVQKGVNSVGLWISDKLKAHKTLKELEEENERLQNQIDSLNITLTAMRQQEQELERLQELVSLTDEYSDYDMVAAHVIAKSSGKWFSTFTIDKGSGDGIQKNMNVIASGGLVGIITDVGERFSTVRSIIDDESNVSAQFEGNGELCMICGSLPLMEQNLLEFTDVAGDVFLSVNDAVVTSHVSSRYMPGILIGYVTDYQLEANDLTQSGHIKPVVDFSDLQEVMIITKVKETAD